MPDRRSPRRRNLDQPAPTYWPKNQALRFMGDLWRLVHALDVQSKRMRRTIGVTGPQRLVLRVVGQHPDATAGQIATALAIHASTLSGIAMRLETNGLIERRGDPGDRRRTRFSLTAAGRRIDQERVGTVEASVRRTLARVDPETVEECRRLLTELAAEIEAEGESDDSVG